MEEDRLSSNLKGGDVVLVTFPSHQPKGHEQEGKRPAIVMGIPSGVVRYPVVLVAPLTTQTGEWVEKNPAIYPQLVAGIGGLSQNSVVLLDQPRAVDVQRVTIYFGTFPAEHYQLLLQGVKTIFEG